MRLHSKKEIKKRWSKLVKLMILYVIDKAQPKGLTEEEIWNALSKEFGVIVK